jgi:hypothetical protein
MAQSDEEQRQKEVCKGDEIGNKDEESTCHDDSRAASPLAVKQEDQSPQAPEQVDINQLHSLSAIIAVLKQRLPEVADKTLQEFAEVQLKANDAAFRRAYLADAKEEGDIIDAQNLIIEHTTPLNRDNWHRWIRELRRNMCFINHAEELLFGDDDIEYTPYLKRLDQRLAATILLTMKVDGPTAIRSEFMAASQRPTGRELLKHIESQLKPCGDWKQVWTLFNFYRVRLMNDDIDKAIADVSSLAIDASDMGVPVPEAHMCAMLLNLTIGKRIYDGAWHQLQFSKTCTDWIAVTRALRTANQLARRTQG